MEFKAGDIIEDILSLSSYGEFKYCIFKKMEGDKLWGYWATTLDMILHNKHLPLLYAFYNPEQFKLYVHKTNWRKKLETNTRTNP